LSKKHRIPKLILKWMGLLLLTIIAILLLLWLAVQFPAVQNRVAERATSCLQERIKAPVSIGEIDIDFFTRLQLKEVYLEDQKGDTLLYAGSLAARLGLFAPLQQKIHVDDFELHDAVGKLYRGPDSTFNFQFILDAFASQTAPDTSNTSAPWSFGLDHLLLDNVRFQMLDSLAKTSLYTRIGQFKGQVRALALGTQRLDVKRLALHNSYTAYASWATPDTTLAKAAEATPLAFPFSGWVLNADELQISRSAFSYDDFSQPPAAFGRFDPNHLQVEGIQLQGAGLEWHSDHLSAELRQLAFRELNGFALQSLSAGLSMSTSGMELRDFQFATGRSQLQASHAKLSYRKFGDLARFVEKVEMEVQIEGAAIAPPDITYWSSPIPFFSEKPSARLQIAGVVRGQVDRLDIQSLQLSAGNDTRFRASGQIVGLPDPNQARVDLRLREVATSYTDLQLLSPELSLPEGLGQLGRLSLNTRLRGRLDSLTAAPLQLRSSSGTLFDGQLMATGLPEVEDIAFQLDINQFRTSADEIEGFAGSELPINLQALDSLRYRGRLKGTPYEFELAGQLNTAAGNAQQDMRIAFRKDYANASYEGSISIEQMELGALLANPSLGKTSLQIAANGSGLSLDSLQTQIRAEGSQLEWEQYPYQNISLDGQLDGRQFSGDLSIADPNLSFAFSGLANLNDSLPNFRFKARLDTANFQALHLYPDPLHLQAQMEVELRGGTLDQLEGFALLQGLSLSSQTGSYQTDSVLLNASKQNGGNRSLVLRSDIAQASVAGRYQLAHLHSALLDFVDTFFPIKRWAGPDSSTTKQDSPALAEQAFDFQLQLSHPTRLAQCFLPELSGLDTAWVKGQFDSKGRRLKIRGLVPSLNYAPLYLDSLELLVDGTPQALESRLQAQRLRTEERLIVSQLETFAQLFQDSLQFGLLARGDSIEQKLQLEALLSAAGHGYSLQIQPSVYLNGQAWEVPADNRILIGKDIFRADQVRIAHGEQALYLQSEDRVAGQPFAPLQIGLEKLQLGEIARLANLDVDYLSGTLQGEARLQQPDTTLMYELDLALRDLSLDQSQLGDLRLQASSSSDGQQLEVNSQLKGLLNDLRLNGSYGLNSGALNFQLNSSGLQLAPIDFFTFGSTQDSRGYLKADLTIGGTAARPRVQGRVGLDSASTFVDYLQTRFMVPQHSLQLKEGRVELGKVPLIDREGRTAELRGVVTHDQFSDIQLALGFSAPSFQVLDTKEGDNELFYGKVLLSADASIQGPIESPAIDVTTTTLPGTQLTVLPLTEEQSIVQEDFIIYGTPAEYRRDTSEKAERIYQTNTTGYDISLRLNLQPEAKITAIIDPSTGDKLTASGRANLLVEMSPDGRLTTTGNITVTSGSYFLNYEGLVKRSFNIQEGSSIYLPGDPLDARFDITAIYTTEAPVYQLIRSQANLDEDQQRAAKRRQEVKVLLRMQGTLSEPDISFELEQGTNVAGSVAEAVTQKFNQLSEDQNELNKQVFGLLLFNSFLTSSGGGDLATTGENIALSSVSGLLSQQLNRLASQYVEGVDLNIGLDSYTTGQTEETVTEVQVGLSKQLFNERLSVQVGGNLGLSDERSTDNTTTAIAGDFLLEYKLTDDGRYRLRVFRRPDYDVFTDGIRTGASLIYKKSFGNFRPDSTQTPTEHED